MLYNFGFSIKSFSKSKLRFEDASHIRFDIVYHTFEMVEIIETNINFLQT
jgi:hypothetical protein